MPNGYKKNIGKKVALGGTLTALGVLCLYLANILPTTKLTLVAISSMFIFVMVIEFGIRSALAMYVATSVLALVIMSFAPSVILYIIFFGYYGIVKYYIEKIHHLVLEWVIKMAFFNMIIGIICFLAFNVPMFQGLLDTSATKWAIWSTVILSEIAFVVYDYGYSVVINYYIHKWQKLLRI